MNIDVAVLFLQLEAVCKGIVKAIAEEDDFGTVGARRFDL